MTVEERVAIFERESGSEHCGCFDCRNLVARLIREARQEAVLEERRRAESDKLALHEFVQQEREQNAMAAENGGAQMIANAIRARGLPATSWEIQEKLYGKKSRAACERLRALADAHAGSCDGHDQQWVAWIRAAID